MGKTKKQKMQTSETFLLSAILAVSGGFQDAYTYFTRDKVFSNAQTGNVVLMSQEFMAGNFIGGIKYLLPFFAFGLGVLVTEQINARYKMAKRIHWRQLIILIEIAILAIVGFIPHSLNMAATVLVSFSCAMQVQAFRKVNGYAFASTMCIGNMRSGVESLCAYVKTKDKKILHKSLCYWAIIIMFAIGAGLGGYFIKLFNMRTIWVSCGLLFVSFMIMFIKEDVPEIEKDVRKLEKDIKKQ